MGGDGEEGREGKGALGALGSGYEGVGYGGVCMLHTHVMVGW